MIRKGGEFLEIKKKKKEEKERIGVLLQGQLKI